MFSILCLKNQGRLFSKDVFHLKSIGQKQQKYFGT